MYDVLIIGGGPAGLSMASSLARQVYSALVLDSGEYRNARASHMHTYPGFDHKKPSEFRDAVRAELGARYPHIEFANDKIATVRKLDTGAFEATSENGTVYTGKKLGLGTGVRDIAPDIPGYDACWGRGVFHCLFCHGFEERGADSVGVLAAGMMATPEMVAHVTLMAKRLSKKTVVYTNGNAGLAEKVKPLLHSSKISYDERKIAKLELIGSGPELNVHFADGAVKKEGFLANHPLVEQRAPFASQLGLEMTETGEVVPKTLFNEASVKGVFIGGDAATMMRNVVQAVQMGCYAGGGLVASLAHDLDAADEL